jgi:hypothetical protein
VNRRTLLQTISVVGGIGLAGCAAIEDFVGGEDEQDDPSTTFGYGGTPTPTATSVATTVVTTGVSSTTAPATETTTPTTTETTTRTTTTTPEDDYGEQGYGQYGYGGVD